MKNEEMKPEQGQEVESINTIKVVYDDGESISCRKAPKKPFNGWPMPRD